MHYRRRFYCKLLEGYELGQFDPEKANILDVINLAFSSWMIDVKQETVTNYIRHCKIRLRNETVSWNLNEATSEEDIHELEGMIDHLGYRNKMNVNQLLDYPGDNNECSQIQSLE